MQLEDLECTSNAVRVQLDCCTNIAPNPRSTLLESNSRAVWQVFMLECPRMRLECFKCCWNVIRMFRTQLEWSWNAVGIHFFLECSWKVLSMSKTFQPPTRMGQNSWNVVGMQLEVLERSWNIQEWTKNFHSNCIPVHSSSSVIGVLNISQTVMFCRVKLKFACSMQISLHLLSTASF